MTVIGPEDRHDPVLVEPLLQASRRVGVNDHVRVDEPEDIALCRLGSLVPRAPPGPRRPPEDRTRAPSLRGHFPGVIRRAVVDHDDLEQFAPLLHLDQGRQALGR